MAIRRIYSFGKYSSGAHMLEDGWLVNTSGVFIVTSSPTPFTGARCLRLSASTASITNPGGSRSSGVIAAHWQGSQVTNNRIFIVGDGDVDAAGAQISIRTNASSQIELRRSNSTGTILATSSNTLAEDTWYHIRFKFTIHNSTGTAEVFVNGSKTGWIDFTGDTQNTANASFNRFCLDGGIFSYYDNVVFIDDDTSDSSNDAVDLTSQAEVIDYVIASGDGDHADFTPSSGSDNGAMVDEATPDDDTTRNVSSTVSHRDSYNLTAAGLTGAVLAVQITPRVKKTDTGSRTMRTFVRIGGSDFDGANYTPAVGYQSDVLMLAENPATTAAWASVSAVDAIQPGVEVEA